MRISTLLIALTFVSGLFSCKSEKEPTKKVDFDIEIDSRERAAKANIRGLFLVNDSIGWASGSGGTFLRMVNGETWISDTVSGYTHLDFRDVHSFDANTALLMAAGNEGRVLRTEDGGTSWTEVYTRLDSGIFLDGMDFHDNVGYCYGDPIDGSFVLIRSEDHGKTWQDIPSEMQPMAFPNEAGFAASGTGIVVNGRDVWIATGGDTSRILWWNADQSSWFESGSILSQGTGCGVFSLCYSDATKLILVGGCYLDSTRVVGNSAIIDYSDYDSENEHKWSYTTRFELESPPRGYRSCVAAANSKAYLVTCGRTGVEYSLDEGLNWIPLSDEGYYTCALADSTGWLMGKRGKMAKLSWNSTQK
ncbi:MAG: hypothetical protein H6602_02320 [Flavobacteriales bacterium]|nr:hypothetical protein [Flavobacteriales bacterium]MCB9190489.1 hypothetical protein [Flavobacteriales bacterium]